MNGSLLSRRWLGPTVALMALLALFALTPRTGFTIGGHTPLWNERPVDISAATTVPAPNWVAIAKAIKPAVANVSTKRIQEGVQLQSPFGDNDPFQQYFKQFFGRMPRHTVRSWARASSSMRAAISSPTTTWSTAPRRSRSS